MEQNPQNHPTDNPRYGHQQQPPPGQGQPYGYGPQPPQGYPQAPPGYPPRPQKPVRRLPWFLLGCLAGAVGTGVLVFAVLVLVSLDQDIDHLEIVVNSPESLEVGQTFDLEVVVHNNGSETVEIGSIDLYDDLLDAFAVVETDRPDDDILDQGILGSTSFEFSGTVPAGGSLSLTVKLKALRPGIHSGLIEVWSGLASKTTRATLQVN